MNKNVLFIIFLIFIRLKYIFLIYLYQDIKKKFIHIYHKIRKNDATLT